MLQYRFSENGGAMLQSPAEEKNTALRVFKEMHYCGLTWNCNQLHLSSQGTATCHLFCCGRSSRRSWRCDILVIPVLKNAN